MNINKFAVILLLVMLFLLGDHLSTAFAQVQNRRATPSSQRQQTLSKTKQKSKPMTGMAALKACLDPRSHRLKNAQGNHLMRRISLLDAVPESKDMQIAFVIDGTDSMGLEIEAIKVYLTEVVNRIKDIQLPGKKLEFALVVYRDVEAEKNDGGEILIPSTSFISDVETFQQSIEKISPVSGAPYFNESVDLGLYRAMDELNWELNDSTEHWIFLFGDAPPYPEGMDESKTGARRSYTTKQLVDLARSKKIKINPVICSSGFTNSETQTQKKLEETYYRLLPETEEFFNELYLDSGGETSIKLHEDDVVEALVNCLQTPEMIPIPKITPLDVAKRTDELAEKYGLLPSVKVAISPKKRDGNSSETITLVESVRDCLKEASGIELESNPTFHFVSLKQSEEQTDAQWFFITSWDKNLLLDGGSTEMELTLRPKDERMDPISETHQGECSQESAQALLDKLFDKVTKAYPDSDLAQSYKALGKSFPTRKTWSKDLQVGRDICRAMKSLETALYYSNDGERSERVETALKSAKSYLESALRKEPDNPYVCSLLANCYYNLIPSIGLIKSDDISEATGKSQEEQLLNQVNHYTELAYKNRDKCLNEFVKKELEADYYLFTDQIPKAIEAYEYLANSFGEHRNKDIAGRAHWALAGIYAGDWNAEKFRDVEKSRDHVISVLAIDKNSQVARYFIRTMEYSEEEGTRNPYIAMNHSDPSQADY